MRISDWSSDVCSSDLALTATVQQMEKAGFEGVFVLQIYGPPFVPLAAASTVTETLKLGTGIAIAGTRSPLETAYAAMDLDRISDGRFVLGLGSRSEEHTSELQSLMRISYAVFCLKKKTNIQKTNKYIQMNTH